MSVTAKPTVAMSLTDQPSPRQEVRPLVGLILNADDWGRDCEITRQTLHCKQRGTISSVSAMVFMADSEHAAALAREHGVDAGLHLNFTTTFTAPGAPTRLLEHQRQLRDYLRGHRLAPAVYHPFLVGSFEYVVKAQLDEFHRLYGISADRLDGHHHMHLCANVLLRNLLPPGSIVRRNFSFQPGEKSWSNRIYRTIVDKRLARRHRLTDFLFSLPPIHPVARVKRIFDLANRFTVEVETHPGSLEEYKFLAEGPLLRLLGDIPIAHGFVVRGSPGNESGMKSPRSCTP
ncbi:MAG TPA: ChbG/HpnK family deacetylase [Terriglobales bacterium]|nr:ChbG/HpnK family deacetylase [Terriglobales bacterium]